jgi:hypothetical protein
MEGKLLDASMQERHLNEGLLEVEWVSTIAGACRASWLLNEIGGEWLDEQWQEQGDAIEGLVDFVSPLLPRIKSVLASLDLRGGSVLGEEMLGRGDTIEAFLAAEPVFPGDRAWCRGLKMACVSWKASTRYASSLGPNRFPRLRTAITSFPPTTTLNLRAEKISNFFFPR